MNFMFTRGCKCSVYKKKILSPQVKQNQIIIAKEMAIGVASRVVERLKT